MNEIGEHSIVIEYQPQGWFYTGALVSATTLIFLMSYLLLRLTINLKIGQFFELRTIPHFRKPKLGHITIKYNRVLLEKVIRRLRLLTVSNFVVFAAIIFLFGAALHAIQQQDIQGNLLVEYGLYFIILGTIMKIIVLSVSSARTKDPDLHNRIDEPEYND